MCIDSVKHTGVRRQIKGDKRKGRGDRGRVEGGADTETIVVERQRGLKPLHLLERRRFHIHHLALKDRTNNRLDIIELIRGLGPNGEIDGKLEEARGGLLELVAKLLNITICGLKHRIAHEPLLLPKGDLRLDLRNLLPKVLEHHRGVDGMDEHCYIDNLVKIDDG